IRSLQGSKDYSQEPRLVLLLVRRITYIVINYTCSCSARLNMSYLLWLLLTTHFA
ncbi:hypothetical protein J6590_004056, partial [Homalodisca vitripennis]